ncbi:MAG: glycosyl transferase, partial [Betaproteobacteria bacterium]|nr:glycosyl transferase [Betaproteobacteria bacterium]
KPMIALPLFWDQYDNAQRIDELGLGVRLATYAFEEGELLGAVDRVLADVALRERLGGIARAVAAADGRTKAAELIERLARERAPVAA